MSEQLSLGDFEIILESLRYSKQRIEEYKDHPSYAFKLQQLERVEKVMKKVDAFRRNVTV